jgi:hypothetical protein
MKVTAAFRVIDWAKVFKLTRWEIGGRDETKNNWKGRCQQFIRESRLLNNQDEMSPVSSQAYLTTLCTKEVDLRTRIRQVML